MPQPYLRAGQRSDQYFKITQEKAGRRNEARKEADHLLKSSKTFPERSKIEAWRPSERNNGAFPLLPLAWTRPRNCRPGITPSFTRITAATTLAKIQESLAAGVESEKQQDQEPLPRPDRALAADEFVVVHTMVGHPYGCVCRD